jgi:hypothetical protein
MSGAGGTIRIEIPKGVAKGNSWSPEEDQVLRAAFPAGGSSACSDLMPWRTRDAVNRRCSLIGVSREEGWRRAPLVVRRGACAPKRPLIDRFRASYSISNSGCWEWGGHKDYKGYGRLKDENRRQVFAHRVSYQLAFGSIPHGMVIDHLCRNPSCVNPDHLEAVTNSENVRRGKRGVLKPAPTECKHGHPYPENERRDRHGRRSCRECSRINGRKYDAARRAAR